MKSALGTRRIFHPICPIHKQRLKSTPIVKEGTHKIFGTNFFCSKRNCSYEMDTGDTDVYVQKDRPAEKDI